MTNTPQIPAHKHLYLIDGSGFIFRAYHALPPLTRADGVSVGAVLGFANMLVKLLGERDVDHIGVIFDHSRKSFRQDLYPAYKANRAATPEDLIPQFPLIRKVCDAFHVPCLEMEGYEADDLMATLARRGVEDGFEVTLVSSDKDLMQLVGEGVGMWDPLKNRTIDAAAVFEKFGVAPDKVVDVQALVGDTSDNIPGVPGIGIKTASSLIQTFGDLDTLLASLHTITQTKRRESLEIYRDDALMSRKLATLETHVPLDTPLSFFKKQPLDEKILGAFLLENDFKSLYARLRRDGVLGEGSAPDTPPNDAPSRETVHTQLKDTQSLKAWLQKAATAGRLSLYARVREQEEFSPRLDHLSLATDPFTTASVVLTHPPAQSLLFDQSAPQEGIDCAQALALLAPILADRGVHKIFHDAKAQIQALHGWGCASVLHYDDVMLMSYCLDGAKHNHALDSLLELERPGEEAPHVGAVIAQLFEKLSKRLFDEKSLSLYKSLDLPASMVLMEMEETGVLVDAPSLKELAQDLTRRMTLLEGEIHSLAGKSFNVASSQQLAQVLFEEQGLRTGKKGKAGGFSTKASELERLAQEGSVLAQKVMDWRQLAKLNSTYAQALVTQIHPRTGRVHTHFSMTSTSTGRLSSSNPNLQNIPIRTSEGRKIRQAFVPKQGLVFVSLDYSQIELRLLAHMAEVPTLVEAFVNGEDIHARTASDVFHVPLGEVTSEQRRRAKAINFGIIYGISAYGLSQQLQIPQGEAAQYIQDYCARYPGIVAHMEDAKAFASEHGYVETLDGRRCFIEGIKDPSPPKRAFAQRQAINAPLQGTAADLVKKAMIRTHARMKKDFPGAKLLLQVHDELIFEVPVDVAGMFTVTMKEIMESVAALKVPLVVDFGMGHTWDEASG